MKKYFCSSDIHGFYDEYLEALNKAGFEYDNPEHILLLCGDIFDRGKQPLEVYQFLKSLPKERRILIRGNHETLLKDLVNRGFPYDNDYHNGTVDTLYALAGFESEHAFTKEYYRNQARLEIQYGTPDFERFRQEYTLKRRQIYKGVVKEILDWQASDEWTNFYETEHYIFVHSFIPVMQQYNFDKWGFPHKDGEPYYREDWRTVTQTEWEDAMWGCPWHQAQLKLNKTGKTIVCGHWHTSDFFNHLKKLKEKKDWKDNPIFISKRYQLIGLDACTAGSHKVNVLVLNEDEL